METTRHFAAMWIVADETECLTFLSDIVAVEAHLSEREQAEVGQFTLWQQRSLGEERAIDRGPFPFFLGPRQTHRMHLDLQWEGKIAAMTFLDASGSEFRILAESPVAVTEETRRNLSGGEHTPLGLEYCLFKPRAFEIARQYLPVQNIASEIRFTFSP
jgi:hypothetical protein